MDEGHPLPLIILFIFLVLICAAFSGSSAAASAANESVLAKKAEEGSKKAARILAVVRKPSAFLSTVDIIITASAIIIGSFIAEPFSARLALSFRDLGLHFMPAAVISYILICLLIIYIVTVFGILFPKRLASRFSSLWLRAIYRAVILVTDLFRPFNALINISVAGLVRLAHINSKNAEENVTEEEIKMMVSEGHEQGVIEESEAEMISNIFEFDDKEVADIMTHRLNVVSIDINMDIMEAAKFMSDERFSRYPVYEDDEDNIVGILHLKDVMRHILDRNRNVKIRDIMRAPLFVPDTQNINTLFRQMQDMKVHMAIVVDEYGQSAGIVAMEDILEEIVGNIMDEYDQDEHYIQKAGSVWYMKGFTPLEMITDQLGIEFDDDFDTLNGFLISRLDRIPSSSEHASVRAGGYIFTVMSVRDNAINFVRVTRDQSSSQGSGDSKDSKKKTRG